MIEQSNRLKPIANTKSFQSIMIKLPLNQTKPNKTHSFNNMKLERQNDVIFALLVLSCYSARVHAFRVPVVSRCR